MNNSTSKIYIISGNVFVTLLFIICTMFAFQTRTFAQTDNSKKETTLKDIFQEGETTDEKGRKKSGAELANDYYKECVSNKLTLLNKKTLKMLCSCKAAKIAETLSPEEIIHLKDDTKEGKAARSKMYINADSACMDYAVKEYTKNICMHDKQFKEIVVGKSRLCKCTANYMGKHVRRHIADLIMRSVKYEPLTLDPISFYLRSPAFDIIYNNKKNYCYRVFVYGKN